MSDIVTLTSNGCQAGCREDEMRVQAAETLAPLTQVYREDRSADVPKHKQSAMGFGI
jgi:hypothetical protein